MALEGLKVLLVEDDLSICELLKLYFIKEEYEVFICHRGDEAMDMFQKSNPNLVILDLMLPGKDGYSICREMRSVSDVPIIMLTARNQKDERLLGFDYGADDYVAKPFDAQELMARVRAIMRRLHSRKTTDSTITNSDREYIEYPDLVVDKSSYTAKINGELVEMPPKELELLFFLASNPNRVFTREQLLGQVWGYDFFGASRTVDVHLKRIREKIEAHGSSRFWNIRTVWGVGYKFDCDLNALQK